MRTSFFASTMLFGFMLLTSSCSKQSTPSQTESHATAQEKRLNDQEIVAVIETIDKREVAASDEVSKKKVRKLVTIFATYIARQHARNIDQLKELSKELHLEPKESTLSSKISAVGDEQLKNLSELNQDPFEIAYIDAIVKGHREGLELIDSRLLPETINPQLKTFVEKYRIMVADHLEKGLKIQKAMQKDNEDSEAN